MLGDDVLDEALERLGRYGPEFRGGLSNHGPMAVEALVRLGRADTVGGWVDRYSKRLIEPPRPSGREPVLGDMGSVADWEARFSRELEEAPWWDVVRSWLPRLAPGIMAAATHGWLRTAHAVRGLRRRETPARLAELSRGLAYWAARYQEVPGPTLPAGTSSLAEAMAGLPRRRVPGAALIFEAVHALDDQREFAASVASVDGAALNVDSLLATAAPAALAGADRDPIVYVHTLTPTAAIRGVEGILDATSRSLMLGCTWRAIAALMATYPSAEATVDDVPADVDIDDIVERAATSGDEHAIKVAEAAFGPDATDDPLVRAAAAALVARLS